MISVYMDPSTPPPPMPDFEWLRPSDDQYTITPFLRECNWTKALEGEIDESDLYFLYASLNYDDAPSLGSVPRRQALLTGESRSWRSRFSACSLRTTMDPYHGTCGHP